MSEISLIVPCYNEEERIRPFLEKLSASLKKHKGEIELILVDDGSTDKTNDILKEFRYKNKVLCKHEINKGKGAAVKTGVQASSGRKIIFIDADGSIDPSEIKRMSKALDTRDIVISSKLHEKSKMPIKQPPNRIFFGKIFNLLANIMFRIEMYDSLCGFKGFRRDAGRRIFKGIRSKRWVFDVEVLYLAKKLNYSVSILPITWKHVDGSKIKFLTVFNILFELISLRASYLISGIGEIDK
ncbi:dolichyl-phosphate beta-glucosyltransferase [Candidatus Undinarchaeota archaeon]